MVECNQHSIRFRSIDIGIGRKSFLNGLVVTVPTDLEGDAVSGGSCNQCGDKELYCRIAK
jgi:hypothetical protein